MEPEVKGDYGITLNTKLDRLDTLLRKISSHLDIQTTPDAQDAESLIDRLIATVDIIEQRAIAIQKEILKLSVTHISKEDYANNNE